MCAVFTSAIALSAQNFAFTIDPAKTWTKGYAKILIASAGSFKGTFDVNTNPLGTQTKLGIGNFTINENDAIPALPYIEMGHSALVRTAGTFNLNVDTTTMKATVSNYSANRVPSGNLNLTASVALNNDYFQTLKPSYTYTANLRPQPLGSVSIDEFKVTQHVGSRTSSIVSLGGGKYAVSITFMSEIELNISEFGQSIPVKFDAPYSLVGFLTITGSKATFGYDLGQGGENFSRQVNYPLEPFPFIIRNGIDVPANLIMTTTIKRVGIQINGTRKMTATAG